jgi:hypothetical protein
MKISWLKLLKALPSARSALKDCEGKQWVESKTIWYNLIKAAITVAAALGIYVELSHEEIETIGLALSVAVPAVATVLDAAANIWLRLRTNKPISGGVRSVCKDECGQSSE